MNDEASRNDALIFGRRVCVGCLIGKQKKPIPFKVTEPSSIPLRLIKTNLKWIQIGSEQLRNVYCEYVIRGIFLISNSACCDVLDQNVAGWQLRVLRDSEQPAPESARRREYKIACQLQSFHSCAPEQPSPVNLDIIHTHTRTHVYTCNICIYIT
jgi:hypothetical protein